MFKPDFHSYNHTRTEMHVNELCARGACFMKIVLCL